MDSLTAFTDRREFEAARALLDRLGLDYSVVSPGPGYAHVGCPALVLTEQIRATFLDCGGDDIMSAGWVDYRPPAGEVPGEAPPEWEEDIVGRVAIAVLAPCVADHRLLRLIAHFGGDVAEALPYLNAEMPGASFTAKVPVLTFMDGHRMVSLFRDRVAVAKADDIVDAWATLERARRGINDTWARRNEIIPSCELRHRPPALEIYKRLPVTNCGRCGERTCIAFAWALWRGDARPGRCAPVFGGDRGDLKDALLAICAGLGLSEE